MKLIIEYPDDMPTSDAIRLASAVVHEGRVSHSSKGVPHFCWLTQFCNGIQVITRVKRKGRKTDSLEISRDSCD